MWRVELLRKIPKSMDSICQQGTVQFYGASVRICDTVSFRDRGPVLRLETSLTGPSV